MKMERLIGIITILLQQDKVTAPQLAERFEVSRRTIQRDIEEICKAGIPLVTMQGYDGGISIAQGYKIDKAVFTKEEVQAVLMGLRGVDSISATSYFASLRDKLFEKNSQIPTENIIIIDLASHYQEPLTKKIEEMKKAIQHRHFISFEYYYQKGESKRQIAPYHLVFRWSAWYVFGYCLERKAYRLFKLNRLWNLKVLEQTYVARRIPAEELDFDTYFSSEKIHLKAIFHESQKHRLIDEYGIDCYCVMENGNLYFEQSFASNDNMTQWIFSFGDKVTIIEPESLILDRRRQAENILYQQTNVWDSSEDSW